MDFSNRIGFDAGATNLEEAMEWAAANDFLYVDFNADIGANHLGQWDDARVRNVRAMADGSGLHIGIHTLSAVNIAEFSPFMAGAADEYLNANIALGQRIGAEWITVHGGFHFTTVEKARRSASIERLKRATGFAEPRGQKLLLENLNFEPDDAEVHYLAHTIDECHWYFDEIQSEAFGWAFTANHANLVPEGIDGFLDEFGISRIGCVRLADNDGTVEVHKIPGEGNMDFAAMFRRLEDVGYQNHYTMAYGTLEGKIKSRRWLVRQAND